MGMLWRPLPRCDGCSSRWAGFSASRLARDASVSKKEDWARKGLVFPPAGGTLLQKELEALQPEPPQCLPPAFLKTGVRYCAWHRLASVSPAAWGYHTGPALDQQPLLHISWDQARTLPGPGTGGSCPMPGQSSVA